MISDVISKDVCVVDSLVTMLSLKNNPRKWVDTIVNVSVGQRKLTFGAKKYDINALCNEFN